MNNFVFSVPFLIYLPKYIAKIQKERVLISRAQWGRALLRPLSLTSSLINHLNITICSLLNSRTKCSLFYKINLST